MSAKKLSDLSGVSKGNILKAERCEMYLNKDQFKKVCNVLNVSEKEILDLEYKFFYDGYDKYLLQLIDLFGIDKTCVLLHVNKATLNTWIYKGVIPSIKYRNIIVDALVNYIL